VEGYTRTAKPGANLGVVHARRKDYRKAVGFFERALMIESDDLTLRSNLAEAYLRDKRLEEAEREYLYILNMAPEHVESIIGLGELYLERGKGDTDMYLRAASKFAEVVGLARQRRGSKRLKDKELAKVHYLWGYALVQSFEGSKLVKDQSLLWDARREFKECVKCDPEHYQARRAAEKIEKGLGARSAQRLLEQLAPYLILAASFFVFGVAQWKYIYTADEKFGATEYAALTFGSLALIAAGAYLPQVLKLKFAGLELEKSNVDQLATLGPLGITEGGSSRSG
jgi:tetratricopeptide (TPR) repeat protein